MIFIASDHAGFMLKEFVKQWLSVHNHAFCDLGVESAERVDYPDYAQSVCKALLQEQAQNPSANHKGILICGSGIGMSMIANRFQGIRAALCTSAYMAHITRLHNDANVLCLGARISGEGEVESMLQAFFNTSFEGGRHTCRVGKIDRS